MAQNSQINLNPSDTKSEILSYKGKGLNLIQLGPYDKIPENLISNDHSTHFIKQLNTMWKLQNLPIHSFLTEVDNEEEILEKCFGKPSYVTNTVHMLEERWSEYPISVETFRYVMKYFREVYKKYKTECCVLLFLNTQTKDWKILVPLQVDTSHASVNYLMPLQDTDSVEDDDKIQMYETVFKDDDLSKLMANTYKEFSELDKNGYVLYGTIHSHCNFGAFHSGVDDNDEMEFDGLHITIGNVDGSWSYASRFIIGGAEYKVDIKDFLNIKKFDEIEYKINDVEINPKHLELVIPAKQKAIKKFAGFTPVHTGNAGWWNYGKNNDHIGMYDPDLWNQDEYNMFKMNEDDDEFDESDILFEEDYIRLYGIHSGKIILIERDIYFSNQEKFPSSVYRKIYDTGCPDIDSSNVQTIEEDDSNIKEVWFFNHKDINCNHKSSKEKMEKGYVLSDSSNIKVKAKKKESK